MSTNQHTIARRTIVQRTIAMTAAVFALSGGIGLANAAPSHGHGAIVLAANGDQYNQYNQGVGGNGSARLAPGQDDNSGVGGNGAAKSKGDPGQTGTAGVGGNARGHSNWKPQQQ